MTDRLTVLNAKSLRPASGIFFRRLPLRFACWVWGYSPLLPCHGRFLSACIDAASCTAIWPSTGFHLFVALTVGYFAPEFPYSASPAWRGPPVLRACVTRRAEAGCRRTLDQSMGLVTPSSGPPAPPPRPRGPTARICPRAQLRLELRSEFAKPRASSSGPLPVPFDPRWRRSLSTSTTSTAAASRT